jgi:hypothetical protein
VTIPVHTGNVKRTKNPVQTAAHDARHMKTPEGTLQHGLARTLAVTKILKIEFWNGIALLCFVALVWVCVWAGLISRHYPLMLMSGIWIVTAVAALLWVKWRAPRNAMEKRQCERLLAKFQETKALERNDDI